LNNRTSLNLFLGGTFGKQTGSRIYNVITPDPINFVRPTEDILKGFTVGISSDHYLILNNVFGIGIELGTTFQRLNSTRIYESVEFQSETYSRIESSTFNNNFAIFLGPTFDLFLSQRININFGIGSLNYLINSSDGSDDSINQFQANISLDNLGLGMEINF